MYHYIVKVPSSGETLIAKDTIIDRIEYFNGRNHYLLFDGGSESEKRFIMVSDKAASKTLLSELKNVFEVAVTAEAINVKAIDRKTLKKIHAAKTLMMNNHYCYGVEKTMFATDTTEKLIERVDSMIGYDKFKNFITSMADYIDRAADVKAKSLYNVVLINECGANLDTHVELLYDETAKNEQGIIWDKYLQYLRDWASSHNGPEFYGMTPACFDEWLGCEHQEADDNAD